MTLTASVVPEEKSRLRGWLDQGRKAVFSRTERTDERRRDTKAAPSARDEPLRPVVAESSWDSVDPLAYDADADTETDSADRPSPLQAADAECHTTIVALEEDTSEDHWTMSREQRTQPDESDKSDATGAF